VSELQADDVQELFLRLVSGDYAGFVDGCTPGIDVVVRHGRKSVLLHRSDVEAWFEQLDRDSGATLCSAPTEVYVTGQRAVVILGHALRRDGANMQYQTINQCEFDYGRLARWTVNPVNLLEYTLAWNLLALDQLLPA
jgi:ketosteroid isomerase-like protein